MLEVYQWAPVTWPLGCWSGYRLAHLWPVNWSKFHRITGLSFGQRRPTYSAFFDHFKYWPNSFSVSLVDRLL
jgi:hypothetical protein